MSSSDVTVRVEPLPAVIPPGPDAQPLSQSSLDLLLPSTNDKRTWSPRRHRQSCGLIPKERGSARHTGRPAGVDELGDQPVEPAVVLDQAHVPGRGERRKLTHRHVCVMNWPASGRVMVSRSPTTVSTGTSIVGRVAVAS